MSHTLTSQSHTLTLYDATTAEDGGIPQQAPFPHTAEHPPQTDQMPLLDLLQQSGKHTLLLLWAAHSPPSNTLTTL